MAAIGPRSPPPEQLRGRHPGVSRSHTPRSIALDVALIPRDLPVPDQPVCARIIGARKSAVGGASGPARARRTRLLAWRHAHRAETATRRAAIARAPAGAQSQACRGAGTDG